MVEVRETPETMPTDTDSLSPYGVPSVMTHWPTRTCEESPILMGTSGVSPGSILSTDTSLVGSEPTSVAS